MHILTNFIKELPLYNESECKSNLPQNYDTYDLFCLKSRLLPIKKKIFPPGCNLEYKLIKDKENLKLSIVPLLKGEKIEIDEKIMVIMQEEVDKMLELPYLHSLVFFSEINIITETGSIIPKKWVKDILKYIIIDKKFSSFIKDDNIYVDLSSMENYYNENEKLNLYIVNILIELYKNGVIIDGKSLKDKWNLREYKHDNIYEGLYISNWNNLQITNNIVDFLEERKYNNLIRLNVGENNVVKHNIARELKKLEFNPIFGNNYVEVVVKDYETLLYILSVINIEKTNSVGKVIIIFSNRKSWLELYSTVSKSIWKTCNCLSYIYNGDVKGYIFSCFIPIEEDIIFYFKEIKRNSIRLLGYLIEQSKSKDIHQDIENKKIDIHKFILSE